MALPRDGEIAGLFFWSDVRHRWRKVRVAILPHHHSGEGGAVKPLDAAYHVVHDYEPSGAASLAPRLGKSSTQLCHEVKPPPGSMAKLGLVDAVKISDFANDYRILHAFAEALDHQAVKVEVPESDTVPDLVAAMLAFSKETAEALSAMHEALADGRLTENEIRRFEKEVGDIAPAACSLVARMRLLAAEQSRIRAVVAAAA
jgi:hypothetical protein